MEIGELDEVICQICDSVMKDEQWYTDQKYDTSLSFYPARWHRICSVTCQEHAIKFNAMWSMKEKLRNISQVPFGTFNDIFGFGVAGGYAQKKYEMARQNPLIFLMSLDQNNFRKFALTQKTGVI